MDGSVFDGVYEFVLGLIAFAIISLVAWFVYGIYYISNSNSTEYVSTEYVSTEKLVPEIRLVTDGKVIDSVYVYTIKN